MNKIILALNAVLAVAVIGLYVMHFGGDQSTPVIEEKIVEEIVVVDSANLVVEEEVIIDTLVVKEEVEVSTDEEPVVGKIVFVDLDKINEKWSYFKRKQGELERKYQGRADYISGRMEALEKERMEMAQLAQSGGNVDMTQAQRWEQDYTSVGQGKQALEMEIEQQRITVNNEAGLKIEKVLKKYAQERGIISVIGTGKSVMSPVMFTEKEVDITPDILAILNKHYK